jgi:hypothetical protein
MKQTVQRRTKAEAHRDQERIRAVFQETHSQTETARICGFGTAYVRHVLKQAGSVTRDDEWDARQGRAAVLAACDAHLADLLDVYPTGVVFERRAA